jgi:putative exporter of polyketide antibiotics
VPAVKQNRFKSCALILWIMILLMFATPLVPAQQPTSSTSNAVSAAIVATNQPTKNVSAPLPGPPVPSHTKRKAGFLAGVGLAILSMLALAVGLALVRTFKR